MNTRSRISAGLLLFQQAPHLQVFVAHPGGPLFAHKDDGCWSIPKGEVQPGEDLLTTAIREFGEETGLQIDPRSSFIPLGTIQQKGGKLVHAWAIEHDIPDGFVARSNLFSIEWPPGSGVVQEFPEIDRAQLLPIAEARRKLKESQRPLLDRLEQHLLSGASSS